MADSSTTAATAKSSTMLPAMTSVRQTATNAGRQKRETGSASQSVAARPTSSQRIRNVGQGSSVNGVKA